jgi:hypothetical protein
MELALAVFGRDFGDPNGLTEDAGCSLTSPLVSEASLESVDTSAALDGACSSEACWAVTDNSTVEAPEPLASTSDSGPATSAIIGTQPIKWQQKK